MVRQFLKNIDESLSESDSLRDALIEALIVKMSVYLDTYLKSAECDAPPSFASGAPLMTSGPFAIAKNEKSAKSVQLKKTIADNSTHSTAEVGDTTKPGDEEPSTEKNETTKSSTTLPGLGQIALSDIDELYVQLLRLVDVGDTRAAMVLCKHAVAHGQYGRALRSLHMATKDEEMNKHTLQLCIEVGVTENCAVIVQMYEQLGWMHIVANAKNATLVKHPHDYRPV